MITPLWIILVVGCIALIAMAGYTIHLGLRLKQLEQQAEQDTANLHHEIAAVNNAAMGVGQRLISVEKKHKTFVQNQQQMALTNFEFRPYDQVTGSAVNGLNADELVDRYGLPEAEADLLTLLQSTAK